MTPTTPQITQIKASVDDTRKEVKESNLLDDVAPIIVPQPGKPVPNKHPRFTNYPYKLAIIGEAPGKDEEWQGEPFVGQSGKLLTQLISKASIVRDALFIGNICQIRPLDNDISTFSKQGVEIQSGLQQLERDLNKFQPNVCLLLGKTALWAAKGVENITDWRGSFFYSQQPGPFYGRLCIASFHPAACLRTFEWTTLLMFDIIKAKKQADKDKWSPPLRDLRVGQLASEVLNELSQVARDKQSLDIEGYWDDLTCISISHKPSYSFIVPFTHLNGTSYWENEEDEVQIWRALSIILADTSIPKTWQNGLYDRFALQYGQQMVVLGNQDDTMLKFWEMYCELEKSLAFQCSILTEEPYYKQNRKSQDEKIYFEYCCRDSAVTNEINERLERMLSPEQKSHYRFNHTLLNPLLYMELRGIKYDKQLAVKKTSEINEYIYTLQRDLNVLSGCGFSSTATKEEIRAKVREILCFKRDPTHPKKGNEESLDWCLRVLLGEGELTKKELGRLDVECNIHLNVDSYKQTRAFLYDRLNLPVQTKDEKITSDYTALLKLKKKLVPGSLADNALTLFIDLGQLLTRRSLLQIKTDSDGRVRTSYNIVGTETSRISSSTSPTGSGYNLQTITSGIALRPDGHPLKEGARDLFQCDDGHYLFQCDLSGADGWTVGAYLAMLGDMTMLEDLRAKLKPAQIVCYMLRHGNQSLKGLTREQIKELLKEVKKEDWDYFACKQGIWGLCYTMGPDLLATTIAKKSGGTLWLSREKVEAFRQAVFTRYRIQTWHQWMVEFLKKNNNVLIASNGLRRKFYGRTDEVLGQALAHLPQVYTTYATNMAMFKLWTDKENRTSNNRIRPSVGFEGCDSVCFLRIEPLHQVHDALIGQFKIDDTAWASDKIKSYFDNVIEIAGLKIKIPFEGNYGKNWALDKDSKVGDIK